MRNKAYSDSLNLELSTKRAMLVDLQSGVLSHGGSVEDVGLGIRQRILRIAAELVELQPRIGVR